MGIESFRVAGTVRISRSRLLMFDASKSFRASKSGTGARFFGFPAASEALSIHFFRNLKRGG
jgi:hypothetical protein